MDWDYGIKEHEKNYMIDNIWEETLGSSRTWDELSEGIKDDIPFDFKDPDNLTSIEMEIGFTPLDLSYIPGYSDELPDMF